MSSPQRTLRRTTSDLILRRTTGQRNICQTELPAPTSQQAKTGVSSTFPLLTNRRITQRRKSPQRFKASQQMKASQQQESSTFHLCTIHRGTDDWNTIIKPFVANLAFRSLIRPYHCHAAVLFVDLSNYSKITADIAHRGAHALSNAVNAYLRRILDVINEYGGDVVKFAGDAILVVWEGTQQEESVLVSCAAKCVVELQNKVGEHAVPDSKHVFRMHCGLCVGPLESEVFVAPTHVHMQRLYHSVGGKSLLEISKLVDLSTAGQTCISAACCKYLENSATVRPVEGHDGDSQLLLDIKLDVNIEEYIDGHIQKTKQDRMELWNTEIGEEFIHPCVLRQLSYGGFDPTHIAQMRKLCVLFIAMTSNGNPVNWLMEVQGVLDRRRCPIVQIIDDDKGVHIVAAVNLYEAIPEVSVLGHEVCRDLKEKQVGCAIGIAMGETFCGFTGSSSVACRWDITGPSVVRSARLMQYAKSNLRSENFEVAIDQSVYDDPLVSAGMTIWKKGVIIKGSPEPVTVYTLFDSPMHSASRIVETFHGGVHDSIVKEIVDLIEGNVRCCVIVTGLPLVGKKMVCQRAARYAHLVPFVHVCDHSAGLLQLARTIAHWFKYAEAEDVRNAADSVLNHMEKSHWSRAHDECVRLVKTALDKGLRGCFVVDRVHFLDGFSLSLIRECLRPSSHRSLAKICFLCTHVPLYNWKSAEHVVEDIARARAIESKKVIPIFKVAEATRYELHCIFREVFAMEADDRLVDAYAHASGNCAGYFIQRAIATRNIFLSTNREGGPTLRGDHSGSSAHHTAGLCPEKSHPSCDTDQRRCGHALLPDI